MMANHTPLQAIDISQLFTTLQSEIKQIVRSELKSLTTNQPKELLTVKEVSKYYGMTESYWRKQIFNKTIPIVKMGKSVRLRRKDIEAFIEDNEVA
jgi:excisionase family DNA binding protein